MSRRLTDKLLDRLVQQSREASLDDNATFRVGKVTAVSAPAKTLDCTVAGVDVLDVPYMASYSPTVNDVVWLLHQGSQIVALGKR